MKRVLMLGGTRYFGKQVVRKLVLDGWNVTIATRGRAPANFGPEVSHVVVDRNDLTQMRGRFHGLEFDLVIDQLCYTPQDSRIAVQVFSGRVGRYIMTSTTAVYDMKGLVPSRWIDGTDSFTEDDFRATEYPADFTAPWHDEAYKGNHYSEGKRQAEGELARIAPFPLLRVRCGHVLDPFEDFTGRTGHYLDRVMRDQPVVVTPKPGRTSHISSWDMAEFLRFCANQELTGVLNAASDPLNAVEFTKLLAQSAGREPRFEVVVDGSDASSPFAWDGDFAMDTTKAREAGYCFEATSTWVPRLILPHVSRMKGE
jgi:nucleoside-diphosphate-sugar epimerase